MCATFCSAFRFLGLLWSNFSFNPNRGPQLRKAMAAWQWFNYHDAQVGVGRQCIRVNLDETPICLYMGSLTGHVPRMANGGRIASRPEEDIARDMKRTYLTHVAMICDNPTLQVELPQVLIGNHTVFKAREIEALRNQMPRNVFLVRLKKAWNCTVLLKVLLEKLHIVTRPWAATHDLVILMDAAKIHCRRDVWALCERLRFRLIIIPASTTWLLQPLDTHVFARMKAVLRELHRKVSSVRRRADWTIQNFLDVYCVVIRKVLQGVEWEKAFDETGFGMEQRRVTKFIKTSLGLSGEISVPQAKPTAPIISACFPKSYPFDYALVFRQEVPLDVAPTPLLMSQRETMSASSSGVVPSAASTGVASSSSTPPLAKPRAVGNSSAPLSNLSVAPVPKRRVLPWLARPMESLSPPPRTTPSAETFPTQSPTAPRNRSSPRL